ncbi:MAG: hypothetical protein M1819_005106 [Sarea resinae]|nr:MAG: hypothetical protein M1819_005106 [Sarea resinae]
MTSTAAPIPPSAASDFTVPVLHHPHRRISESIRSHWPLSRQASRASHHEAHGKSALLGLARRTLGITLLLATVILWTVSNFLASTIFADNTYSKPYFVTYINTAFFALSLIPIALRKMHQNHRSGIPFTFQSLLRSWPSGSPRRMSDEEQTSILKPDDEDEDEHGDEGTSSPLLREEPLGGSHHSYPERGVAVADERLDIRETAKLSLEFCFLWFAANYFAAACLEYTTVASSTILTSTSSCVPHMAPNILFPRLTSAGIWTLIFGALFAVEKFSVKKTFGVFASMAGIVLVSTMDLNGENDKDRGSFPHKSHRQVAIGDAMACVGAIMYGFYSILMKKRIGDEARVNMPLFFGLVGLFNVLLLWPGFVILHLLGEEKFQLPPTGRVWLIVLTNSATSLLSDFCWAYAMLLTSPLVVTVGLSLTIPLSLVGQMILNSQKSSLAYWIGACVVFLSFIFVNHEDKEEEGSEDGVLRVGEEDGEGEVLEGWEGHESLTDREERREEEQQEREDEQGPGHTRKGSAIHL